MAIDIGPKIGIDGEAQFRQQINAINQTVRTLGSEMKVVTSGFTAYDTAETKAAKTSEVLGKQIDAQKQKVALLAEGLQKSTEKYGAADTRTLKWQQSVNEATANLKTMQKQLDNTDNSVDEIADSMDEADSKTSNWGDTAKGVFAGAAIVGGIKATVSAIKGVADGIKGMITATASAGDEVDKMSQKLGLTSDAYQEWDYVLGQSGVEITSMSTGIKTLTSKLDDAKSGSETAAAMFEQLGISTEQLKKMSREEVFAAAISGFQRMADTTERAALANDLFGKSGQALAPLFNQSVEDTNALKQAAHDLGFVMSGDAVKASAAYQDTLDNLNRTVDGVKNSVAAKMLPAITDSFKKVNDQIAKPEVKRNLQALGELLGKVFGTAIEIIAKVAGAIGSVIKAFTDISKSRKPLRDLTDDERDLLDATNDAAKAHQDLRDEYGKQIEPIMEAAGSTERLWKELQTLADESGHVHTKDRDRAEYILGELNEAMGTEYTMSGNQITQYQRMRSEIEKLIQKRQAESLIAAGQDSYTDALKNRADAVEAVRIKEEQLTAQEGKTAEAENALNEFYTRNAETLSKYGITLADIEPGLDGVTSATADLYAIDGALGTELQKLQKDVTDSRLVYQGLEKEYGQLSESADGYYREVNRYQEATAAAEKGNYEQAVKLMLDETEYRWKNLDDLSKLSDKEKQQLKSSYDKKVWFVKWYKKQYEAGIAGYTESELREAEAARDELGEILAKSADDAFAAGQHIGNNLANGINGKFAEANRATQVAIADLMQRIEGTSAAANIAAIDTSFRSVRAVGGAAVPTQNYSTNVGGVNLYVNGSGTTDVRQLATLVSRRIANDLAMQIAARR